MGCVYLITNSINQMQYVGKTVKTAELRFIEHLRSRGNKPLSNATHKYGKESFSLEVLFESDDEDLLFAAEAVYVEELGTRWPGGYNMTDGGIGPTGQTKNIGFTGHSHSVESKLQMGSPGKYNGFYGKQHTEESKQLSREKHYSIPGELTEDMYELYKSGVSMQAIADAFEVSYILVYKRIRKREKKSD